MQLVSQTKRTSYKGIQKADARIALIGYFAINNAFRLDPTRTGTIRRRFEAEIVKRFRKLKGVIRSSIVEMDCFGLTEIHPIALAVGDMRPTARRQFAFPRSSDKISAFMSWLDHQEDLGILEVTRRATGVRRAVEAAWTDTYIQSAYQKGMIRGRQELRRRGVEIASFEEIPGGAVSAMLNQPMHADRAGLLFTRAFNELKGIDDEMDRQISRVLTQDLIEGRGARQIARHINERVDKIGLTRAKMLARTEIIRAHAEASLTELEAAGVEGVEADVEFTSAGFNVCPECSALIGQVFTIQEARGMIPLHPRCRCSWLPSNVGEDRREARQRAQEQKRENVNWWERELEREQIKRRPDASRIGRIRRTIDQLRETI